MMMKRVHIQIFWKDLLIKKYNAMNKYTIITMILLTVILFTVLYFFDIQYKWWYFIPIYFISNYNGKVLKATFQGINLANDISLLSSSLIEDEQYFTFDVIMDFKGGIKTFEGSFNIGQKLTENDLLYIITKHLKKKEIFFPVVADKSFRKTFNYNGKSVELEFYGYILEEHL